MHQKDYQKWKQSEKQTNIVFDKKEKGLQSGGDGTFCLRRFGSLAITDTFISAASRLYRSFTSGPAAFHSLAVGYAEYGCKRSSVPQKKRFQQTQIETWD